MTKKTHKNRNPGRDPSRKIEIEIKNNLKAPPAFIPFTGNVCFSADKKGMKTQEQVTPMYNAFPELENRAPALDEVLHPIPATIGPGASAKRELRGRKNKRMQTAGPLPISIKKAAARSAQPQQPPTDEPNSRQSRPAFVSIPQPGAGQKGQDTKT